MLKMIKHKIKLKNSPNYKDKLVNLDMRYHQHQRNKNLSLKSLLMKLLIITSETLFP